ncbi:type II secretion system protein, partial [bacterium]|nr:type II secretion system protein [bacterium]
PSAEILSANLTTNAQNDETKYPSPLPPLPQGARGIRAAFTLAEVLVTLGIIGIVAAMTLPMLANKYQWFVRQQQFKKAYAALNIAVQKTQIDMGESVRCHYGGSGSSYVSPQECEWFYSELVKNLQVIKTCKGNALEQNCIAKDFRGGDEVYSETQGGEAPDTATEFYQRNCGGFKTSDIQNNNHVYMTNSFSIIPYYASNYGGTYPYFLLDINNLQGPNKWGYDIFVFRLLKAKQYDSVFSVSHNSGCHALDYGGVYTKHFVEYLYGQNSEDLGSVRKNL